MVFVSTISTPANTLQASPLSTVLKVMPGYIYNVKIDFPFGSCRLLHVQIFDGPTQIYPKTIDESFTGHGTLIQFDDQQPVIDDPFILTIKTWNLDDYYDHSVKAHILMMNAQEYAIKYLGAGAAKESGDALASLLLEKSTALKGEAEKAFSKLRGMSGSNE